MQCIHTPKRGDHQSSIPLPHRVPLSDPSTNGRRRKTLFLLKMSRCQPCTKVGGQIISISASSDQSSPPLLHPSFQISQREHLEAFLNLSRLVSKQGGTTHTSNFQNISRQRSTLLKTTVLMITILSLSNTYCSKRTWIFGTSVE